MCVKVKKVGIEQETLTRDVSCRGVYFQLASPVAVGSKLEFTLALPEALTKGDRVVVRCTGKVVRVEYRSRGKTVGIGATIQSHEFIRDSGLTDS